ncbi:MAG: ATP-binding cassette domain-containing protein [Actinomycetota bacterium]
MTEPAPATEPALRTEGLRKTYGSLTAVDELNLVVPAGTIFGLIGPNGAGKTTTFQILATLLEPSGGRAWVGGHDSTAEPREVRRVLGYMPDFFGVYDDVRVWEYLDFFAAAYGQPPEERKRVVPDLLELVDLSHKRDDFVESLSRGMKQRLGLARALVHDPQVLILDEPASGLDPRARIELRELMLELQRMGKTILISSHILSELGEVCTYVGILEAGRMLVQGRPSDIAEGHAGGRVFRVRLSEPGEAEKAQAWLLSQPVVSGLVAEDSVCQFLLAGDDAQAADVLRGLVGAQIGVVEFSESRTGLEELFMNVTKGIVQ